MPFSFARTRLLPRASPSITDARLSELTMACSSDSSAAKGRPGKTFAARMYIHQTASTEGAHKYEDASKGASDFRFGGKCNKQTGLINIQDRSWILH